MLQQLELEQVGPTKALSAELGNRLNVFTGDNGLGKSFLLDICFWALTQTWPQGRVALPDSGADRPRIEWVPGKRRHSGRKKQEFAMYDHATQAWSYGGGQKGNGVVIYAGADGGFTVWDSARNWGKSWPTGTIGSRQLMANAFDLSPETLANGLQQDDRNLCNGLIQDWVTWYYERSSEPLTNSFSILEEVVSLLSHPHEPVRCDEPQRVFVDDATRYPTLAMPYGQVPFPQWPAGIRRIVSLAYVVTWAWTEHLAAAKLRNESPTNQFVVIVDEIESHLHPKWQRTILPALLRVAEKLQPDLDIQLFAATHSPLVLASLEPHFEQDRDKLFWFDLDEGEVRFREYPWTMQGDVVGWLTSDIFGLKEARSREAERAIKAAQALMRNDTDALPVDLRTKEEIHAALLRFLPGMDPFWPRWIVEVKP